MSANPMTKQAWLDYLEKTFDEFDWSAAGQEREWVGLTDEEVEALASWWPSYDQMPALKVLIKDVQNSLRAKNET